MTSGHTRYRFGIVGTGWRAEFFLRLARAVPEHLEVARVIGRRPESVERIAQTWDVPVGTDIDALAADHVDFVATAVPKPANPGVILSLAQAGHHVLAETPPAPDVEGLRELWTAADGMRERIQVAEQYHRMPTHAARLAVVRSGAIGTPHGVEVSSTHEYHAVALIRRYLGIGRTPVTASACMFEAPMIDPADRAGYRDDPQPEPRTTTLSTLDFGEGRYGTYDFVDNQWHNPLLSRRILVRGSRGELMDDIVLHWDDNAALTSTLQYRRLGTDMDLEGLDLAHVSYDGHVVYTNPLNGARLSDDDLAVAVHLIDMGRYAREGGVEPYPLADGMHDHAIAQSIAQSARSQRTVTVTGEPWME